MSQIKQAMMIDREYDQIAQRIVDGTSTPEDLMVMLKYPSIIRSKANAIREWSDWKTQVNINTQSKSSQ